MDAKTAVQKQRRQRGQKKANPCLLLPSFAVFINPGFLPWLHLCVCTLWFLALLSQALALLFVCLSLGTELNCYARDRAAAVLL